MTELEKLKAEVKQQKEIIRQLKDLTSSLQKELKAARRGQRLER